MRTTVMGLGKMGRALAAALVDRGHDTTVWNRTPGRLRDAPFTHAVTHAATAEDAVAASDVVVLCLLDFESVVAVLDGVDLRNRTIVNLTTATPAEAAKLSALLTERGADYVDGGIMAIPSMIGTPAAVVLYSGSEQAFRRSESALQAFGEARYLGAAPGMAALNDIAMLTGMYGMFGGFVHAAALVRTEGVAVVEFTETLLVPWLRALFPALVDMAGQIDSGDYTAKESDLSMQVANDGISVVSRAQGVSSELSDPLFALMRRRVEQGFGGDDFPSVVELLS
ncbi:NAD(P)-dependent oxidoreductase [Actinophytocola sp. NPDC049390]|uniref:NAD(P)-dependent oxidoreductase n=1 Tax=Actinophytocola sp. NPDC049390 TaxID=3363894 RepID=UPI0037B56270